MAPAFPRRLTSDRIGGLRVARRNPTCPVGATTKWWFRGEHMSGRLKSVCLRGPWESAIAFVLGLVCLACLATVARSQERREREPNSVYAERRAKLAAQADGPIVLWGFTGREESSQADVFAQEGNFNYLTGHNEEGAGLIILPAGQKGDVSSVSRETLFLPVKNP